MITVGDKFGLLTVISIEGKDWRQNRLYLCECNCGNKKIVRGYNLKSGQTKGCGCLIGKRKKHGESNTRLYRIWNGIEQRCNNISSNSAGRYGGRGIVCHWESYEEFSKDMKESYEEHVRTHGEVQTSIDRIDNNGGYCKENCRWATKKEQGNNRNDNVVVEFAGVERTMTEHARHYGIDRMRLKQRLSRGRTLERALLTKPRKRCRKSV